MTDPRYETLASFIERELALVAEREFERLDEAQRQRAALQSALPAVVSDEDRPALERCGLLQRRLEIELARVREAILIELRQVRHAQRAADGYAPVRPEVRQVVASA